MRKRQLVSSIAIMSVMWGATAFAQEADNEAMEELIVTATKRSERMLDVPISMSAFSAKNIEETGIRELKDIAEFIPNLHISQVNDFRQAVTIRGVGAHSRNIGFDTRVGVYVDGVYMGQSPALNQELLDLERVEVLRGPQGTLFGKNTVAGAVNLITRKPGDEFEGKVTADFGNRDYTEFKAMVNVPLSDSIGTKFSIAKTDRDGYVKNLITGNKLAARDVLAYRGQIRIQASDKLEINASFDGLDSNSLILVGDPVTDMLGMMPESNAPNRYEVAFDIDPHDERDVKGGGLDITYDLDNGHTFKSITGYRDTSAYYTNATDYSPIDMLHIEFRDDFEQFSQEFQFISPDDGKFTYMAGLYYFDQKADSTREAILGEDFYSGFVNTLYQAGAFSPLTPASGLPVETVAAILGFGVPGSATSNYGRVNTESVAAYFNGSYEFSDKVKLGFGARYSEEKKDVSWTSDGRTSGIFFIGTTGPDPLNPTPITEDRKDKFFAPAASLTYALSDTSNIYVKYAAGYKSGGFNLDFINADELLANPSLAFDKETVDSFEVGYKASMMDGDLRVNLSGFMANYDDYQVNQFVDLGEGNTSIRITNAAKVKTSGLEADFNFNASESLTFQGSLGLLSAEFDSFPGGGTGGTDATGNRLVNAPKFNAAFGAQYYRNIASLNSNFMMRADVTHASGHYLTANNDTEVPYNSAYPGTVKFGWIESTTQVHGRIGLMSMNDTWEVYLWGRNLTNEKQDVDGLRDFFNTYAMMPGMGRSYGFEVGYKF